MSEITVSASSLMDFLTCRQRARFRLDGWRLKVEMPQRAYGTLLHDCLAWGYRWCRKTRAKGVNQDKIERGLRTVVQLWINAQSGGIEKLFELGEVACVLIPLYFEHWYSAEVPKGQAELRFDAKLWGVPVRGRVDLLLDHVIYETKTMSRIKPNDLVLQAELSLQNRFYTLALNTTPHGPIKSLVYDIIRKPQLHRGKAESLNEFVERVQADIERRPTWYFQRISMTTAREPEKIRWSLRQAIKEYRLWREGKLSTYQNTCSCVGDFVCDFAEVCAGDQKIETDPRFHQKRRRG